MALPLAPGEVAALIKYAMDLCQRCAAAPEEFQYASIEVEATSLNFQAAKELLEKTHSAIYEKENAELQRSFRTHCNNCHNALKKVEVILVKYEQMAFTDRFLWAVRGKGDLDKVMVHVGFVTTRMEGFLNFLDKNLITAGRIERHLERTGNAEKAIQRSTSGQADVSDKDRQSFSCYASRLCQAKEKSHRHHSADKPSTRRPGCYLECWVIKKVSSPGFETTKKSLMKTAEQKRGQWKLEEMAKQFKNHSGNKKLLLERDDDRVEWILREKRRHEKDAKFEWKFVAARVESKTASALGLVVEERVMVIIRRQMTPKAEAELRKKEEAKKKAKQEAAEREKQKAKKKKKAEEVEKEMAKEKATAEAKAKQSSQQINEEMIKKAVAKALKEERKKIAKKKEEELKGKQAAQKKAKDPKKAVPVATTEQPPVKEAKDDNGRKAEPKKDAKRVVPLATTGNKPKHDNAQKTEPKKDPATGAGKPSPPKPSSPKPTSPEPLKKKDANAAAGHQHGGKEEPKTHDDGKKHVHWEDSKKGGKKP